MAIETGLRTLLLSQPNITTLIPSQSIGGITYQAVFVENPAQGFVPPFVLISKIDIDPWLHLGASSGTHATEFDIDCYATGHPAALALAEAVKDFLEDYTGSAGTNNTIKAVLWQGGRYDKIAEGQGRDVRQHIESRTFVIQHTGD